jgi:pyruvate kinase
VLDGVDGILLGAETLRGKYPVQTVETVLAICHQAEKVFDHHSHFENLMQARARALKPLRLLPVLAAMRACMHA